MSRQDVLYQPRQEISRRLLCLSRAQVSELSLYCIGCILAGSCSLSAVALALSSLTGQSANTVRQRLREWYLPSCGKRGGKRRAMIVSASFAALLAWIVDLWPPQARRIAVALDASLLKDRFAVLSISVLIGGCAIPVAWTIVEANQKGQWKPHWLKMLQTLSASAVVPQDWCVLVLADRGLYARWLFDAIVAAGWHPMLRICDCGKFQEAGTQAWRRLEDIARERAHPSAALRGLAFRKSWRGRQLPCTLLVLHAPGQKEAWFVLTDLAPSQADVRWYGLRAWIEEQFRTLKRGALDWHKTRMRHTDRAERL